VAKFALEEGETQLSKHSVQLSDGRKWQVGTIVLTSRRLVTLQQPPPSALRFLFGPLGAILGHAVSGGERHVHTIRRERFAEIELDGAQMIVRDSGSGYDHTSFAFSSKESFAVWHPRLERWAASEPQGAPLHPARVVDQGLA